ncbi:hypothetical protein DFH06DRAFT_1486487 [Mycena polygramma]|nr:hypothetical protein DFH06DRAFT_1486487 [Mycena polygramma]
MHHCLQVGEIVDMICYHLDPRCSDRSSVTPYRSLAVAARTCTIFQRPALDRLWSQANLGKLLTRCMPPDLWAVDIDRTSWRNPQKVRLLRTIRTDDWDRLRDIYAPRVKHLSSGSIFGLSDVLPILGVSLPPTLFPNLRTLDWAHLGIDFFHVHLFLHPRLTKISLTLAIKSASCLLPTLTSRCPNLIHISIASRVETDQRTISDFVRGLRCPENIFVPTLDQDALEQLSQLTSLNTLSLHGLPSVFTPSTNHERRTFPGLRRLSLDCGPKIGQTTQFLRLFHDVPLDTFSVGFAEYTTAAEVHKLFRRIAAGFSHSSLTSLTVNNNWEDMEGFDPTGYFVPLRTMRLLVCFVNLTELEITSLLGFDLDDDAIAELARAFPRIVTLRLKTDNPINLPRTTPACLYSFAEHCPRLNRLTLAFDGAAIPAPDADPRSRPILRSLRKLGVEHSPLSTVMSAARFLSGVFPNLNEIETHREFDDNTDEDELLEHGDVIRLHNRWKEVSALLPEISAIREEGRKLASSA